MRTNSATDARVAKYVERLKAIAPALEHAVAAKCVSGKQLAAFLNAVHEPAPNGGTWNAQSANHAVRYLIQAERLMIKRHRGPNTGPHGFQAAVDKYLASKAMTPQRASKTT